MVGGRSMHACTGGAVSRRNRENNGLEEGGWIELGSSLPS